MQERSIFLSRISIKLDLKRNLPLLSAMYNNVTFIKVCILANIHKRVNFCASFNNAKTCHNGHATDHLANMKSKQESISESHI